jgi:signal transduction histidine kinase
VATPGRLEQVLDNLIENALAVAPAGTVVKVTAARSVAGLELHVVDAGPGLTPAERARAFDRFWRADPKGAAGGSGLGLAIVARLVQADGGTVELRDPPGGGLDAVVGLPAAATSVRASAAGEDHG